MDHIPIPEEQVVPMDAIAPGILGLRIAFVNVFSVTHPDGSWTLIDAAIPHSASMIRKWAETQHSRPPAAIVLTHGHFDHVSAAAELAADWDVPIYAHPLEFPYLTGEKAYAPPNPAAGGGLMSLLAPLYPRGPIDVGDRLQPFPIQDGAPAPSAALPGWQVLHTPGHTPGHVSFYQPEHRILLVGDAFCTTKPESFFEAALVQAPELHGPPAYFTSDWNAARASVQRLASLDVAVVAPGHGKALAGEDVSSGIRQLAERFDEVAIPENRKPEAGAVNG